MLLTLEKVIVLKAVEMFSEMAEDVLAGIALSLQEIQVRAEETIIREGEPGTTMYVIVEGQVRVHADGRTLATLSERAAFGELSALDPERRSASVTAVRDTHLLALDHDVLYELISERQEVAHGIIRFLVRRYGGRR
jgi:CRP-like cAMP-binding protein